MRHYRHSLARRHHMGAMAPMTVWEGLGAPGGYLDAILGPAVGGGTALGVTLITRAFTKPESKLGAYAGLLGAGAGIAISVPLGFLRGWQTAVAGMIAATLTGVNMWLSGLVAPAIVTAQGVQGMGLITPEQLTGMGLITPEEIQGLGLITPEEIQGLGAGVDVYEGDGVGDTGEAVQVLEGVNLGAFGTNIVR